MWQAPGQKTRPTSKKSGREHPRHSLTMKRVTAEIRTVGDSTDGQPGVQGTARILLNDLSAKGVGFYSNRSIQAGQEIAILMNVTTQIYLRGTVVYCQEQESKMSVISENPYYYRMGVRFIFSNADEEAAVAKYCKDLVEAMKNGTA